MPTSLQQLSKRTVSLLPDSMQERLRRHHYLKKLRRAQITDEPDLAAIALLTKPGDTVLDIGANFGLFTRFLSESVGSMGKVYSFEPTVDMFDVLRNNCSELGLGNATCLRTALSDVTGRMEMSIPIREDGTLNHYEASLGHLDAGSPVKSFTVETSTLDDFCRQRGIDRIDFIKCDVEGHELEVLSGATETLKRFHPPILLEVNDPLDLPGHGSEVLARIRELGYHVHVLDGGRLRPRQAGEVFVNYVLLP
ncbi:MAG TPA: FkbM family methyltransferase [Bacteroidia bacterium]|nr:FkbM family methyltransferase [Bacteroidia bacterium]